MTMTKENLTNKELQQKKLSIDTNLDGLEQEEGCATFEVECVDTAMRLDAFLKEKCNISRSQAKAWIEAGAVLVNGMQKKASSVVTQGQIVAITPLQVQSLDVKAKNIPLHIVYEDEDIAVINKQQGLTVHAGAGTDDNTLVNALLYHLKDLSTINGVIRPGIVHRIDKDTSGLLVVAKNDMAHLSLAKQIEEKSCKREYLALCEGIFADDSGTIEANIARHPTERIKMTVVKSGQGRFAKTNYTVLHRFDKGYTVVLCKLETGRTHQIRVHLKSIGHPIVGDAVYGLKKQKFQLNGQLLHAFRLSLTHPRTQNRMTFYASLPEYFCNILKKI